MIFEDEIISNKTLDHDTSLIFTESWALANGIMLNVMQNLILIFSKTNFELTGAYVLSSISRNFNNFFTVFFSMYRGILELQNHTSILWKNGLFANKTCFSLTTLFVKTEIYFY